jgi:dihydropteroate synthase
VTVGRPVEPEEEIARVVPVVEALARDHGALVSVDTYKAQVAHAAIEAGAAMIKACAGSGAALVLTHTRARPKQKLEGPRYADVVEDVRRFLAARIDRARSLGVPEEQILLCPGPDLGKQPAQTIALVRRLDELHELGRPLLLAVSRKDFLGALVERPPRERLAATLAAVAHVVSKGAHVLRLHDVAEAADFLEVSAVLRGEVDVPDGLRLADDLRREAAPAAAAGGEGRA